MGHTTWSQRTATQISIRELTDFTRAMSAEDREIAHELLRAPRKHIGSISNAASLHVWAFTLLTIIIEQEKRIRELEEAYATHRCIPQR